MKRKRAGFATRQIHSGGRVDPETGALVQPIYQTSTFVMHDAQAGAELFAHERDGYIYTRLGNPNHRTVEARVADLENAEAAVATASGMGAISALLFTVLHAGDHMLAGRVLYGCTHALLRDGLTRFGVEVDFVPTEQIESLELARRPNTRLLLFESPTNPDLSISDLAKVCEWAHQHGILVVVDNTFCTPYLQRPIDFGADVVVHSATKYLNGHGDVIAGFAVGKRELMDKVREVGLKDFTGAVLGPFEAFLTLRGMKTLSYRMEAHCRNADCVARYLEGHPWIERVMYPGLESHPQHALAIRQMKLAGGMLSFEVRGGKAAALTLIDHVRLISIAVSLGDTESLIQHPATMTHSTYSEEERRAYGITDGMVRLSLGLEDPEDIVADLEDALHSVARHATSDKVPLAVWGKSIVP
jgi:methionine-gamma-lyase